MRSELELIYLLICLLAFKAFVSINIFLIKERQKMKEEILQNPTMKFIKANDLQSGDVFKINPRQNKEHWVDRVHEKFGSVVIETWGRKTLSFKPDDMVFLIKSTNNNRKENANAI